MFQPKETKWTSDVPALPKEDSEKAEKENRFNSTTQSPFLTRWHNFFLGGGSYGLFNDALSSLNYVITNERIDNEEWIVNDMEGSGDGIIQRIAPGFSWWNWEDNEVLSQHSQPPGQNSNPRPP
jgi:hypothetical protein